MKLSVSVPDELWQRAQQITGTTSASKIVQQALTLMEAESADDIADIWSEHPFLNI